MAGSGSVWGWSSDHDSGASFGSSISDDRSQLKKTDKIAVWRRQNELERSWPTLANPIWANPICGQSNLGQYWCSVSWPLLANDVFGQFVLCVCCVCLSVFVFVGVVVLWCCGVVVVFKIFVGVSKIWVLGPPLPPTDG